ncbi:proclotting enzyme [Anabrus simplex]|uniref:proclotting enzyme n=1 Tax=Anabrus simplex TaxID=316456 RepID=UPI0035A2FE43
MKCYASSLLVIAVMWIQVDAIFFSSLFPQRTRPGLCLNCQCGRSGARFKRLVGGTEVPNGFYPWLASVYVNNDTYSGALISNMHVITAASATRGVPLSDIKVGLGTGNRCTSPNSGLNTSVSAVTNAPGGEDLAVLTLSTRVNFNNRIRPVCLPPFANSAYQNQVASMVSWGLNSTNATDSPPCVPRQLLLPILPAQACYASYSGTPYTSSNANCVGVQGTPSVVCSSDAGGLVQYDNGNYYQLIGILPATNECDGSTDPAVYVRTAPLLPWLLTTTRDSCYCTAY